MKRKLFAYINGNILVIDNEPNQIATLLYQSSLTTIQITNDLDQNIMDAKYGFITKVYFNKEEYAENYFPIICNLQIEAPDKAPELIIYNQEDFVDSEDIIEELGITNYRFKKMIDYTEKLKACAN